MPADALPQPLEGRKGLRTESAQTNVLARELGQLARRNGLRGCVLLSFTDDRVGVNSSGTPDEFGIVMESLADRLLCAFDDETFDPDGLIERLKAEKEQADRDRNAVVTLLRAHVSDATWNGFPEKLQDWADAEIERLKGELVEEKKRSHRLAHTIDPRSETPRAERPVEELEAWADGLREQIAALTEKLDAAIARADAYALANGELKLDRNHFKARAEHWERSFAELLKRTEKVEAALRERALDTEDLDWLESELRREQEALAQGAIPGPSLFRSNRPITRAAIRDARSAR